MIVCHIIEHPFFVNMFFQLHYMEQISKFCDEIFSAHYISYLTVYPEGGAYALHHYRHNLLDLCDLYNACAYMPVKVGVELLISSHVSTELA